MFQDPSPSGDTFPANDLLGALLLFTVTEDCPEMNTTNGVAKPVRANVAVLDGPRKAERFEDALIFPKLLAGSLRTHVGAMVLGRLKQGVAKPGQSAPYVLEASTPQERETGEKYVAWAVQNGCDPRPQAAPAQTVAWTPGPAQGGQLGAQAGPAADEPF
jgi:hypothetical protein